MTSPPVGLRARKKEATSAALRRWAIELFLERGFAETTVQDIADAAGISQRTFFRYYPTKDAVIATEHARRERELAELLEGQSGTPLRETAHVVLSFLCGDVSKQPDLSRLQARVFLTVPTLADRFSGHLDRLGVMVGDFLAQEMGVEPDSDPRPRLLAAQIVRSWTTAVLLWLKGDMEEDLEDIASQTLHLARTDPLLVDGPASPPETR